MGLRRNDLKRGFVEVADGQLHYRMNGHSQGDQSWLVMLHGNPGSSYSLVPLMRALPASQPVIALDLPGYGDSSPLESASPVIPDYVSVVEGAVAALNLGTIDLYGFHMGAIIATEMVVNGRTPIGRMILDGASLFSPSDRDALLDSGHAPLITPDLEGTQFSMVWEMVRDAHLFWPWWDRSSTAWRGRGLPSPEYLHGEVLEVLKAMSTYHLGYRAGILWSKRERLPLINIPTLVTADPRDQLFEFLDEVANLVPDSIKRVGRGKDDDVQVAGSAAVFSAFLSQGAVD